MHTRTLKRLMHLVLATATTQGALMACGGGIDSGLSGTGSNDPNGTGAGSSSSGSTTTDDPYPDDVPSIPTKDAGKQRDVNVPDVNVGDVANADVIVQSSCINGEVDPSPSYCCNSTSDPNCSDPGSGDSTCPKINCQAVCDKVAPGTQEFACFWNTKDGTSTISYLCGTCGVGRVPDGTALCERGASVGDRLARQAYYEAVSVIAFERLAEVLIEERAPASLVRRVKRAADDERRHAEIFTRLATERGVAVPAVELTEERPSLHELALENVREGCVRETFGALVALHQAENAVEPELREAFASIAEDEIAHAELSWDLAKWFESRVVLGPMELRFAIATMREVATRDYDATDRELGMPAPSLSRAMFDDLFTRLAA